MRTWTDNTGKFKIEASYGGQDAAGVKLKKTDGSDLHVSGSGQLIQLLLENDLVDELWLLIHPLTLGTGKKLFGDGTIPAAFTLTESLVSPTGVIIANYKRAGEVKTGTIGA